MSSYLTDGHPTRLTFYALGTSVTIYMKEQSVTPPGLDGGDPNDTTTMLNVNYRTKQPKKLIDTTPAAATFSYDPRILDQLLSILNVNGVVRIDYPNGDAWEFWGWLASFTPGECVEGAMPTATARIECGNQDDSNTEVGMDYQAAA